MSFPIRRLVLLAGALLLRPAAPLAAQGAAPARIEGIVFDSLKGRPLAGATVTVMQVTPAPQQYFTAVTDAAGRYRVDSLVAGRFRIDFSTPFLDSLEIQFPQRELALAAGEPARVDFATPSRGTLSRAACPGIALSRGRGAIVGQVVDADNEAPMGGATVVVSWVDLAVDLRAMKASSQERNASVVADSLGRYRLCGLPTDSYIVLQVQQRGKAGTPIRSMVAEDAGVMVRNLSLSAAAARDFATADSVPATATDTATRTLTGTASVSGVVRTPDGAPVSEAQVRVLDAAGTARTDAAGHFSLANLPAGTQLLEVRRVGFLITQQALELRGGRGVTADVRLARIVTLDSVRIVAQRVRLQEFERRARKETATGTILREEQIEKLRPSETSDIVRNMLGFTLVGHGIDAKLRSTRGITSFSGPCDANVVIDGQQHQGINLISPQSIAGIEVYRGAAGAPLEYDSSCGVVVIWTKR
jgi:phosphoribosylcarboxyaminoimidazole (NCAIR) mutase